MEKLSNKWLNNDADAAADMSNALNTIIDKVFEDYMLLGYELLQNADDAGAAQVSYYLIQDYLVVSHDGATFSKTDVERLCSFGPRASGLSEDLGKAHDLKKIGYKGIGFKSVFRIADQVWVFSKNDAHFRFDKSAWEGRRLPWQLMPLLSTKDSLPSSVQHLVQDQQVTFVLKLIPSVLRAKKANGLDSGASTLDFKLAKLFRKEHLLLFLRNIEGVSFYWQGPQELTWNLEKQLLRKRKGDIFEIKSLHIPASNWIVKAFTLAIPAKVRAVIQWMDDRFCPPKLKEATEIEIAMAARFGSKDELVGQTEATLFTYLPTEAQFNNIPFYVNSNFLLNNERTELLPKNEWNAFLFESIGYYQFEWFAALNRDKRFRFSFTDLIAKYADSTSDFYHQAINVGVERASRVVSFVPVLDSDELKKIPETVVEKTGILEKIPSGKNLINSFYEEEDSPVFIADPQLKAIDNLVRIGARKFDRAELAESVRRYSYFSAPDTNGALLRFLFEKIAPLRGLDKMDWHKMLFDTPFVLTENMTLRPPNQVFFPTKEADLPIEVVVEYVHDAVFTEHILAVSSMASWLEELGSAYPEAGQLIGKVILPALEAESIPADKLVECTQYIFKYWRTLDEDVLEQLALKLPYFSLEGKVRSGRGSYLADAYAPQLALEAEVGKEKAGDEPVSFTSPIYIENEADTLEWKAFFKQLGHREDFDLSFFEGKFSFEEVQEEYPDYCAWFLEKGVVFPKNKKVFFETFLLPRYFHLTETHEIALKYWSVILQEKYEDLRVKANKAKIKIENDTTHIPSYFHFLCETKPCFPAKDGQCYPISVVYSQALEAVVGALKPVSALELSAAKEEFLGMQQSLSLDACLDLLAELAQQKNKANKEQIAAIYTYIVIKNYQFNAEDNKHIALRSTDGSFVDMHDVLFFNVPKYARNTQSKHFLALDLPEKTALKFCKKMQIPIVQEADLVFTKKEKKESSLGRRLQGRLPFLAALLASKTGISKKKMLKNLENKFALLTFWQAENPSLSYQGVGEKVIFQKEIRVWKVEHEIFHKADWQNRASMYALSALLEKELEQEGIAHEIDTILSFEDEKALEEWMLDLGL